MKHQKVFNLLNRENHSKFVTRNWNIVNDQSNVNYSLGNDIIYITEVLKSNLCDYNDVSTLVKGDITITKRNLATDVGFKNCASFLNVS